MEITSYALEKLAEVPGIKIYGTDQMQWRGGVISFNFSDVHPHDVAQIMDGEGIAIRSGHHCAQVLMESSTWLPHLELVFTFTIQKRT